MREFTFDFGNKPKKLIADSMLGIIGRTPLVELSRFAADAGVGMRLLAKAEFMNPCGSVKDRIALAMIEDAEERGLIGPGSVIIEPTSGNTGIGLAAVGAVKGYRVILTMPESMSKERRAILSMLGAELVLTPAEGGMTAAVEKAKELAASEKGAFIPSQFTNPANPKAHMETTAKEILGDTYGHVDLFVAGVGSGGTVTGVGKVLKAIDRKTFIAAVEPAESPVLKGGRAAPHKIEGIGANFVPEIFEPSVIDEIVDVSKEEAYRACRAVARTEGLLVGVSSGAALAAAVKLGSRPENSGKNAVVLLPDGGDRYLSTELYSLPEED